MRPYSTRATLGFAALATLSLAAGCRRSEATPARESAHANVATAPSAATGAPGAAGALTDSVSTAADKGRIRGTQGIWVIEVSDFQCPYCKRWHDESFAKLEKEYVQTGKVRMAYLNFPLSMHANARAAAEAAMCASVQDKFWPMHESLFATQEAWAAQRDPSRTFDSLAVAAGVNAAAWRSCVSSHATAALIDADRERSTRAGVESTPTFFIGSDRKLEGAYPVDTFRVAINAALAKARATTK